MSTRGTIARLTANGWRGVYTHLDSNPTEQGRAVWNSLQQRFGGDVEAFLHYAIDEHSRGWNDFQRDLPYGDARPQAWLYETDNRCTASCNPLRIEWVYAVDSKDRLLAVYRSGRDPVGHQGYGHLHLETYRLDGPEPDWRGLEDMSGDVF